MKKSKLIAFAFVATIIGTLSFTACQKEESQPEVVEFSDAATALKSTRKVDYIVSKFYSPEDEATIKMINDAYIQLSKDEIEKFIELDYQRRIKIGEDAAMAALHRSYRQDVNRYSQKHFAKNFNALAESELKEAHNAVMNNQKYLSVGGGSLPGGRVKACTAWYSTGSIQVRNQGVVDWRNTTDLGYLGEFSFCYPGQACQSDCDYLYRSRNYSRYYYSAYLWHTTTSSYNVLNYRNCNPCFLPSRRIAVGSNEEFLQFGAGKDRVIANYGFFPANFGKEVIVKLTVR